MGDEPESSSAALERYLISQLEGLSISVPPDDVEYMARFVEEEGLERDEKVEGVKGMLEGFVEDSPAGIDEALGSVVDEWERLKAEAEAAEESSDSSSHEDPSKPTTKNILSTLSPEELAAAQKAALIRQYAYLDATDEEIAAAEGSRSRDPKAPPKTIKGSGKDAEAERQKMIQDALRLDAKKKKHRKAKEVDLLAPNLNREKVEYAAKMEREAARRAAGEKKERDRAALEKQRADAAKAKADKQKKAAKQERRA